MENFKQVTMKTLDWYYSVVKTATEVKKVSYNSSAFRMKCGGRVTFKSDRWLTDQAYGNLVCPVEWDLMKDAAIEAVTEFSKIMGVELDPVAEYEKRKAIALAL